MDRKRADITDCWARIDSQERNKKIIRNIRDAVVIGALVLAVAVDDVDLSKIKDAVRQYLSPVYSIIYSPPQGYNNK